MRQWWIHQETMGGALRNGRRRGLSFQNGPTSESTHFSRLNPYNPLSPHPTPPPPSPNLRVRIWRCWFYEDEAKNFKKFKVSFIESWEGNRLSWLVWLARGSRGLVSNMAGVTLTLYYSRSAAYTQVYKNRKGYRCVKSLSGDLMGFFVSKNRCG